MTTTRRQIFVGDQDPRTRRLSVLLGDVWIDTSAGPPYAQKVRRTDAWDPAPLVVYIDGVPRAEANLSADGGVRLQTYGSDGTNRGYIAVDQTTAVVTFTDAAEVEHGLVVSEAGISMYGLDSTDPVVAGAIWSDAGTLKVSAG